MQRGLTPLLQQQPAIAYVMASSQASCFRITRKNEGALHVVKPSVGFAFHALMALGFHEYAVCITLMMRA
jgi:hypothetical protein